MADALAFFSVYAGFVALLQAASAAYRRALLVYVGCWKGPLKSSYSTTAAPRASASSSRDTDTSTHGSCL